MTDSFYLSIVLHTRGSPSRIPAVRKNGFTFLEIVAALAVLALGIVAVITLFPVGLQNSRRASEKTRAALLVYQELQRYRSWGYAYAAQQLNAAQAVYRPFAVNDPYFLNWFRVRPYPGASPGVQLQEVTVTASWPSTQTDISKRRSLSMSTLIGQR